MPVTRNQNLVGRVAARNASNRPYSSPQKARLRQAYTEYERNGPTEATRCKQDIFARLGFSTRSANRILAEDGQDQDRTATNQQERPEKRGKPASLSLADLDCCEQILTQNGHAGRALTWQQLALEADLAVSGRTLQRGMGSMDYRRCIACRKSWVSPQHAARRVAFARRMLELYPTQEHWKHVRFSDEVHFSFGPQGRHYITRKPGERYCADCVSHAQEPQPKDKDKLHCWAAVGYSFKSDLHLYDIESNKNGKMTAKHYRDEILEKIVKPWQKEADFVLEEDQDSAHGIPRKGNGIVQQWKRNNGLVHYFNCSGSPDLSPAENAWQPLKQGLKKYPHWTLKEMEEIVCETWYDGLRQASINKWCMSMPQRLQAVIDAEGAMTSF